MKLDGQEESGNVDDRRDMGRKVAIAGGGAGIVVVIVCLLLGVDPRQFLGQGAVGNGQPDPAQEPLAHFTKVVFNDTEVVWKELFRKMGMEYKNPKLVLFDGEVESECGPASAAVGPFYCPADQNVYIDLSFYREMEQKLNAGGDFARAYVVAHEVGHHVQNLLDYPKRVAHLHPDETEDERSVRLELQADYFAGVWAYHGDQKYHFLEPGDIESAINAAYQIGDDRLRQKAGLPVVPEKFTHGSSKQRMKWFRKGYEKGDVKGAVKLVELDHRDL